mmetsp:Transcript_189/g.374  ORF Transcript_189/g.374 Transcript_189/m.374 type:complete len:87 (-) Transcript_189:9-269(-)
MKSKNWTMSERPKGKVQKSIKIFGSIVTISLNCSKCPELSLKLPRNRCGNYNTIILDRCKSKQKKKAKPLQDGPFKKKEYESTCCK